MAFTRFVPTDAQGVWGKGGVDSALQTRRRGSLQVQHGLSARGRESLRSPQPHPRYLPRTAHSRAERRRRPLAHLHASRRADPQPRRGRHPPATRPAPHVREGWHQADGLHHRRPHRQADHPGLSERRRRSWDIAAMRGEKNCVLGKWDSKELTKQRHVPCQNLTLHSPRTSSPLSNRLFQRRLSEGSRSPVSSGCICMCPELLRGVLGLSFLWRCCCHYAVLICSLLPFYLDA